MAGKSRGIEYSVSLTAWWAFLFWYQQHLWNLHDLKSWTPGSKRLYVNGAMFLVIGASIFGNFFASLLAGRHAPPGRYRRMLSML